MVEDRNVKGYAHELLAPILAKLRIMNLLGESFDADYEIKKALDTLPTRGELETEIKRVRENNIGVGFPDEGCHPILLELARDIPNSKLREIAKCSMCKRYGACARLPDSPYGNAWIRKYILFLGLCPDRS